MKSDPRVANLKNTIEKLLKNNMQIFEMSALTEQWIPPSNWEDTKTEKEFIDKAKLNRSYLIKEIVLKLQNEKIIPNSYKTEDIIKLF